MTVRLKRRDTATAIVLNYDGNLKISNITRLLYTLWCVLNDCEKKG